MKALFINGILLISNLSFGQESLLGKWVLDIDMTIGLMEAKIRSNFSELPEDVRQRAKESMRDREFIFEENSITVNWKSKDKIERSSGTWRLLDSTNRIVLTIDGRDFEYSLEHLGEVLILKSEDFGGFFNNLYFIKSATK